MNIVVEGSIGVGKTTLIKALVNLLSSDYKVNMFLEPLEQWNTPEGDILSLFGEKEEYAFLAQTLIMSTIGTEILVKTLYINTKLFRKTETRIT